MGMREKLTAQLDMLWRFLGFFQSPSLRLLHAVVLVLVFLQYLNRLLGVGWVHMAMGMILFIVGLLLVYRGLWEHGPRYYFPYLWGSMAQVNKDVSALRNGKFIIAPRPMGLATVVQGLGMGALIMSLLTGLWIFRGWQLDDIPQTAKTLHEVFVWLLLAYTAGHGGMAMIHFVHWQKVMGQKK